MKRTISAVLCAALALTLAGCAEEKEPMLDQTVTVETTAAQPGELSTESTYIGTISAEGTASVVSLVYFFKPALAPVLAWQLHGEAIPANMMAGILLIVAGSLCTIIPGLLDARRKQRA